MFHKKMKLTRFTQSQTRPRSYLTIVSKARAWNNYLKTEQDRTVFSTMENRQIVSSEWVPNYLNQRSTETHRLSAIRLQTSKDRHRLILSTSKTQPLPVHRILANSLRVTKKKRLQIPKAYAKSAEMKPRTNVRSRFKRKMNSLWGARSRSAPIIHTMTMPSQGVKNALLNTRQENQRKAISHRRSAACPSRPWSSQ